MPRAGSSSCPIPTFRRSSKRRDTRGSPTLRSFSRSATRSAMNTSTPIKAGVIMDLTGPLSFMGIASANVARMVIGDINDNGGLLGRRVELLVEDSATEDSAAEAAATKLVQKDHVDVVFGGIYSSTRQAIKGPVVADGKTLYIYPEQYEGQECD